MDKFTFLVLEMRVVARSFLLRESCCFSETLFIAALDDLGNTLINFMTAVLLQVPLNDAEEGYVANARDYEEKERASEHENGEQSRDCEGSGDQVVPREVLADIEQMVGVSLSKIDRIKREGVDGLTRPIS